MNKYELMNCLHQYTPWEMLHMQNMDYIQSIEGLNQSLEHSLTQEDKAYGLHLPTEPALPPGIRIRRISSARSANITA